MIAPTHLHAPDLAALLAKARTSRARFVVITDAPALPPGFGAASDASTPVASVKRPAHK